MSDDLRTAPTLQPPPAEPVIGTLEPIKSIPVHQRSAFDNMVLEMASLTAHVSELRDLVLHLESTMHTLTAAFHSLETVVKFTAEQMGESVSRASEETLRARQAVIQLAPRLHDLEARTAELERRRRVGNGEDL